MIYLVEDFKVIYCKRCKKKPSTKEKKICKNCAVREYADSVTDNFDGKVHTYQWRNLLKVLKVFLENIKLL